MAHIGRLRRMDDFILNPIMSADAHIHTSDLALAKSHSLMPVVNQGKQPMSEPHESFDFMPLYTSDEEGASPVDDDDTASEYSECSEISIAEVFEVQHVQCAQLVIMLNPGKPRMVEMSKPTPSPRASVCSPPSGMTINIPKRKASLRMPLSTRNSQDSTGSSSSSQNDSISSTAPESPASTAPSSLYDERDEDMIPERKHKRMSHVDLMQAVRDLPQTPITPPSPQPPSLSRRPSAKDQSINSVRRKRNFSSGFALRFGRRDPSRDTMESVRDRVERAEAGLTLQRQGAQHKRYSNGRPTKLVARAANERAPSIVLPPFPGE
ncbi:hypothetical protein BST61_g5669 [Cercospora zeina]